MKYIVIVWSCAMSLVFAGLGSAFATEKDQGHRGETIAQHRAIAQAHIDAAKCLEAGQSEKVCHAEMSKQCKGLAIGKYCGMKHQH